MQSGSADYVSDMVNIMQGGLIFVALLILFLLYYEQIKDKILTWYWTRRLKSGDCFCGRDDCTHSKVKD
jgi:hypothetical protein